MIAETMIDKSVINAALYVGSAVVSMLFSYAQRRYNGEAVSLGEYFLKNAPGRTVAALGANIVAMLTFISTGALDSSSLAVTIAFGLMQGYTADAAINKGQRQVWDEQKRQGTTK